MVENLDNQKMTKLTNRTAVATKRTQVRFYKKEECFVSWRKNIRFFVAICDQGSQHTERWRPDPRNGVVIRQRFGGSRLEGPSQCHEVGHAGTYQPARSIRSRYRERTLRHAERGRQTRVGTAVGRGTDDEAKLCEATDLLGGNLPGTLVSLYLSGRTELSPRGTLSQHRPPTYFPHRRPRALLHLRRRRCRNSSIRDSAYDIESHTGHKLATLPYLCPWVNLSAAVTSVKLSVTIHLPVVAAYGPPTLLPDSSIFFTMA
uniref:Uncharacterized protein n=1 Tax=Setaria digitata TaxID=48799 RepID=A0A915PNT7_9BILA